MDDLAGAIAGLQCDLDRIERSLVVAETVAALLGEGDSAHAQGTHHGAGPRRPSARCGRCRRPGEGWGSCGC